MAVPNSAIQNLINELEEGNTSTLVVHESLFKDDNSNPQYVEAQFLFLMNKIFEMVKNKKGNDKKNEGGLTEEESGHLEKKQELENVGIFLNKFVLKLGHVPITSLMAKAIEKFLTIFPNLISIKVNYHTSDQASQSLTNVLAFHISTSITIRVFDFCNIPSTNDIQCHHILQSIALNKSIVELGLGLRWDQNLGSAFIKMLQDRRGIQILDLTIDQDNSPIVEIDDKETVDKFVQMLASNSIKLKVLILSISQRNLLKDVLSTNNTIEILKLVYQNPCPASFSDFAMESGILDNKKISVLHCGFVTSSDAIALSLFVQKHPQLRELCLHAPLGHGLKYLGKELRNNKKLSTLLLDVGSNWKGDEEKSMDGLCDIISNCGNLRLLLLKVDYRDASLKRFFEAMKTNKTIGKLSFIKDGRAFIKDNDREKYQSQFAIFIKSLLEMLQFNCTLDKVSVAITDESDQFIQQINQLIEKRKSKQRQAFVQGFSRNNNTPNNTIETHSLSLTPTTSSVLNTGSNFEFIKARCSYQDISQLIFSFAGISGPKRMRDSTKMSLSERSEPATKKMRV